MKWFIKFLLLAMKVFAALTLFTGLVLVASPMFPLGVILAFLGWWINEECDDLLEAWKNRYGNTSFIEEMSEGLKNTCAETKSLIVNYPDNAHEYESGKIVRSWKSKNPPYGDTEQERFESHFFIYPANIYEQGHELVRLGFTKVNHGKEGTYVTYYENRWWDNEYFGYVHSHGWAVPIYIHEEQAHWQNFKPSSLPGPRPVGSYDRNDWRELETEHDNYIARRDEYMANSRYVDDDARWHYDLDDAWMDAPDAPKVAQVFKQAWIDGKLGRHWNTRVSRWKPRSWEEFMKKVCEDIDNVLAEVDTDTCKENSDEGYDCTAYSVADYRRADD